MGKGFFIVLEGMDGSGKSTEAKLLAERLKRNHSVLLTKEPTDGKIGKLLQDFYLTKIDMPVIDALLFCADREEHLRNEVIPAVEQGKVVVSDRYYHSTLAYQQAQGLDLQWLLELNKSFLKPDLTIIIDCEPEACIERIEKNRRMDERKKFETLVFLKKLRKYFLQLPKVLKGEKIVVVDGNRSVEEVYDEVVRLVEAGMQ